MNVNNDDLLIRCSLNKLIRTVEFQKDILTQQNHYKNILNRYEALFISVDNEEKRKRKKENNNVLTINSGLNQIQSNSNKIVEEKRLCYHNSYSNKSVEEKPYLRKTKSCYSKHELNNRPSSMFKESMVQLWERIHHDFSYKHFLDNNFSKRSYSETNLLKKTFFKSNFLDNDFSESGISEHSIFSRCFEYDLDVVMDITESFLSDSGFLRKEIFNEEKKTRFYEQAIANEKNLIQEIEFQLLKKHKEKSNVLNSLKKLTSHSNKINIIYDNSCDEIEKILCEINDIFNYPILNNIDVITKRIFFDLKVLESSLIKELSSQTRVQEAITSNPMLSKNTYLLSKQLSSYGINQFFCNTLPINESNEKYRMSYLDYFSHSDKTDSKQNTDALDNVIDDTPDNSIHDNHNLLHINKSDNQNDKDNRDKNAVDNGKKPFNNLSQDRIENYSRKELENRKVVKSVLKYFPQSKDNLFGEINPHYSPFWNVIKKNT